MYRVDTSARANARWTEGGPAVLEFAILGLLHEGPMHGYELRKRLTTLLGAFRAAISYGSLYPTLRRLQSGGWITEFEPDPADVVTAPPLTGRRGRVVYKLTADGKERFAGLLGGSGPETYDDDEGFGVHFAFFSRTDAATRMRILEGRRRRVEERRDGLSQALTRASERLDEYTLELQRHGLESADREVRWLNELIANEQAGRAPRVRPTTGQNSPTDSSPPPGNRPDGEALGRPIGPG
jgi:DNA-binding PadR family transcriptional regulator